MALKRDLSLFDLTNIVVGAVIGSDIYIASALTAGLVGPLSVVLWVVAGAMATVLALIFAYSAYYVPKVGGPFAYVSTAFGDFWGFLAGWSMWIAEVISLPVFAITFVNYLGYFVNLALPEQLIVKAAFLFGLTAVNIFGVRAAGRVNDALTFIKLSPLLILVVAGFSSLALGPSAFASNYFPLAPSGFANIGTSIVLIFWAYVGFEMGTLPADEVRDPAKTIPRAIIMGMAVILLFYVSTNFIIFGSVGSSKLSQTAIPLVLVGATLIPLFGGGMMSIGALFSVSGSDESGILGTARLSYALSIDGLFPKIFARVHHKYRTPYASLIIQGAIAFVLSIFSGLSNLISFSVLNLSFCFLLVSVAFIRLAERSSHRLRGHRVLPLAGIAVCLFLLYLTSLQDKLVGSLVVLAGVPLYVYFSPKVDMDNLKAEFLSTPQVTKRYLQRTDRFLGRLVKLVRRLV